MNSRRTDWLFYLNGLLMVGLAGAAVGALFHLSAVVFDRPVLVEVRSGVVLNPESWLKPSEGVSINNYGTFELSVHDPRVADRALDLLTVLPTYALVIAMSLLLLRLGLAARRDPFTADVVRRLRVLGTILVTGGPVVEVVEFAANLALVTRVADGGIPGDSRAAVFEAWWLLAGLAVLAVAEVVNRAHAMRAELDEVI